MREIKFRAWDTENKKMEYASSVQETPYCLMLSLDGKLIDDAYGRDEQVNFPLMQYTGLKDKNGKECYEGDLVKHPEYHEPLRVEFDYDQWGLFDGICNEASFNEECEVIGNIYEN